MSNELLSDNNLICLCHLLMLLSLMLYLELEFAKGFNSVHREQLLLTADYNGTHNKASYLGMTKKLWLMVLLLCGRLWFPGCLREPNSLLDVY